MTQRDKRGVDELLAEDGHDVTANSVDEWWAVRPADGRGVYDLLSEKTSDETCDNHDRLHEDKDDRPKPNEAKKLVADWLTKNDLSFTKLTAKAVGFSDLARDAMAFVKIWGWKPSPKMAELKKFATENGFRVETDGPFGRLREDIDEAIKIGDVCAIDMKAAEANIAKDSSEFSGLSGAGDIWLRSLKSTVARGGDKVRILRLKDGNKAEVESTNRPDRSFIIPLAVLKPINESLDEAQINAGDVCSVDLKIVKTEAAKQGTPGQHWLKTVTDAVKKGGNVKILRIIGDVAEVESTFIMQAMIGSFNVPLKALTPVNEDIDHSAKGVYGILEAWGDPLDDNAQMLDEGSDDQGAAEELHLFISNDGDLYRQQYQPILKNLATKIGQGKYDHKLSVKMWMYLVENGAKKYAKEVSDEDDKRSWNDKFPPKVRQIVAQKLADEFRAEWNLGNYKHLLPAKYQKTEMPQIGEDSSEDRASLELDEVKTRPRDEADAMLEQLMNRISPFVKKLQAQIQPIHGGIWGYVKNIATFLVGNELDWNATNFEEAIKRGNFSHFYVDDRVLSGAKKVESNYAMKPVGVREFVAAVKELKRVLATIGEPERLREDQDFTGNNHYPRYWEEVKRVLEIIPNAIKSSGLVSDVIIKKADEKNTSVELTGKMNLGDSEYAVFLRFSPGFGAKIDDKTGEVTCNGVAGNKGAGLSDVEIFPPDVNLNAMAPLKYKQLVIAYKFGDWVKWTGASFVGASGKKFWGEAFKNLDMKVRTKVGDINVGALEPKYSNLREASGAEEDWYLVAWYNDAEGKSPADPSKSKPKFYAVVDQRLTERMAWGRMKNMRANGSWNIWAHGPTESVFLSSKQIKGKKVSIPSAAGSTEEFHVREDRDLPPDLFESTGRNFD